MGPKKGVKASSKASKAGTKRKHEEVKAEDTGEQDLKSEDTKPEGESGDNEERPQKSSKTASPLDWLFSDEAFDLANPEIPEGHGEIDYGPDQQRKTPPVDTTTHKDSDTKDNTTLLRYPQSPLTPFQNLVCASILSKPLSHRLGLRTTQTLLNPPFSLRTLKDLDEAGYEGRRKVMWEARTQHKERTASLLGDLCEGVKELCGENEEDLSDLKGVKKLIEGIEDAKEAQKKVTDVLTKIKGIGPGVAAIFLRRVQGAWEEVYPFIDEKGLKAARAFDLIGEKEGAAELAGKIGVEGDEGRKRFVRLVDTLVGLELEKKTDEAVKAVHS